MKKLITLSLAALLITGTTFSNPTNAADWRFPLGFSYISGMSDVADLHEENLEADPSVFDASVDGIPVGLAFRPYVEIKNLVRIGADVGPAMLIIADEVDFFNLAVNLTVGLNLIPSANISPYIRAGVAHNISSGDFVEDSNPGFFGAVGIEFLRKRRVGFGFEVAIDQSEIEFERVGRFGTTSIEKINPSDLVVSAFVIF